MKRSREELSNALNGLMVAFGNVEKKAGKSLIEILPPKLRDDILRFITDVNDSAEEDWKHPILADSKAYIMERLMPKEETEMEEPLTKENLLEMLDNHMAWVVPRPVDMEKRAMIIERDRKAAGLEMER